MYTFKDSCEHLVVSLSLELPVDTDAVSMQIRDSLIADFARCCRQPGYDQENEFSIEPYGGDMGDAQAIVYYYGKAAYDFLYKGAMSDFNERMKYVEEDNTLTAEDKEQIKKDVPQWAFELTMNKTTDAVCFVVYQSMAYVYYGGAHGGVTGSGALTFDKSTGRKIGRFVNEDATADLQPLIRNGLLQYYSECGETLTDIELGNRLQTTSDTIPQPVNTPYPNATGDSLVFTYRQYEIVCYADGMPSFKISVNDLMPYLTDDGKALFDRERMASFE